MRCSCVAPVCLPMSHPRGPRFSLAQTTDSSSVTVASESLYRFMKPPTATTVISERTSSSEKWARRSAWWDASTELGVDPAATPNRSARIFLPNFL